MNYIAGIDGGGTKTKLIIVDANENVVCELLGEGINRYSLHDNAVSENLSNLMNDAMKYIKSSLIKAICIGTAGAVNEHDRLFYKNILLPFSNCIEVYDDAYIMLFANLHNEPGIVFTCGTGSIFYGKSLNGEVIRIGGWGHMMSDEGSGYEIGLAALKSVAKNHDLQNKTTKLTKLLFQSFDCNDFIELVSRVHMQNHNKKEIALLAEQVNKSALLGDVDSINILKTGAIRLSDMCEIVIKRLTLDKTPFLVMANGSIIQKISILRMSFDQEMKKRFPMCTIRNVCVEPAWGAVELARRQ